MRYVSTQNSLQQKGYEKMFDEPRQNIGANAKSFNSKVALLL